MKYALLVYSDQSAWSRAQRRGGRRRRGRPRCRGWNAALRGDREGRSRRRRARAASSQAADEAKVVRVRDGELLVTDGPFPDTKEQIGGIFIIELPDLDEAIRIASLVPAADYGSVEIRPLVEH